jgi:tetratricopeptide (TPR) repeat protein
MKFGPEEMAQMMDAAKALITVLIVSSAVIGLVIGTIVTLYQIFFRHRADHFRHLADDQSFQSGMPTIPAQEVDATAPHSPWSPVPRANNLLSASTPRLIALLFIIILLAIAGGGFFWYYTSMRSDFEATSNQPGIQPLPPTREQQQVRSDFEATYNQLGIQPLPLTLERQQQIQSRLAQLSREPCYRDAVIGLGRALLDAGYPREAAISLRTFVKRCGSAPEVLWLAYTGFERINDFSAALEVANELVEAVPANGTFRYWRALAYDRTGQFSLAIVDYMNTVQLFGNPKIIFFDVFYKWSQTYAALGRYCDAISPIEMYISLDPANRRTPQTVKIISDYAEKGNCNNRSATGTARVSFAGTSDVRTLTVVVNGVAGNLILDTGATFVSITSQFARKAKVATEPGKQVILKTVGGKALAEIGYANSVSVGKAEALGVVTAVLRDDSNPFGNRVDGLLGMNFLSRFNIKLSRTAIELTAIPLR